MTGGLGHMHTVNAACVHSRAGTDNEGELYLCIVRLWGLGSTHACQGCHEPQGESGCVHIIELSMGLLEHSRAAWTVVGDLGFKHTLCLS